MILNFDDRFSRKIIDCFGFFQEKELLELRIRLLSPYVDKFLIYESNLTFSGNEKEYICKKILEELKLDTSKIEVIEIDLKNRDIEIKDIDYYIVNSCNIDKDKINSSAKYWARERIQRDEILFKLNEYDNEDIFILSDCDEIINPKYLSDVLVEIKKERIVKIPLVLLQDRANLRSFHEDTDTPVPWDDRMFICTKSKLLECSPTQIRLNYNLPYQITHITHDNVKILDMGWHFSNMGDNDHLNIKLKSTSHCDDNINLDIINVPKENSKNRINSNNIILKKYSQKNLPHIIFEIPHIQKFLLLTNNKLNNFPRGYYMSLEESVDRRISITNQFAEYGVSLSAVISKRFSECDDVVTGQYIHQLNAGTTGCCVSHLKAIKYWYDNYPEEDYAFFCEDDLSLETVNCWNFTWEEFIESLPEDAECVQLMTIRGDYDTFELRERYWDDWSATAYIITREYAKKIIDTYIKGDTFHLEIPNSDVMPLIENILFTSLGKSYTIPLFIEDVQFGSTFSKDQDDDVNAGQKRNHYQASIKVLEYWRNKFNSDIEMDLQQLITEYSIDSENPIKNFNLGVWYETNGHTAPALSYYLRCAERADDLNLAYEALIRGSYCYEKQGTRDGTAKSLLQQALCLLPNRPEAYFLLSRFSERREWWQDCYIYADQGLMFADHEVYPPLNTGVEYPGKYGLLFEKAVSGYWWGKNEECKEIFLDLKENYPLTEEYRKSVNDNLKRIGVEIPEIKTESIIVDKNFFETEYQNACNNPSDINQNLPVLYEIAKECSHITEFGVRTGSSTRAFLNTNASLRSYDLSIDPYLNLIFKKALEFGKDVSYIEADVLNIEIEETDLLFIDTWHQYEQLKQELKIHGTKSKKYIAFHDTQTYGVTGENCSNASSGEIVTGYMENPMGLLPAIIEFMIENPEWQFKIHKTNNNGLTVLEKKKMKRYQ